MLARQFFPRHVSLGNAVNWTRHFGETHISLPDISRMRSGKFVPVCASFPGNPPNTLGWTASGRFEFRRGNGDHLSIFGG